MLFPLINSKLTDGAGLEKQWQWTRLAVSLPVWEWDGTMDQAKLKICVQVSWTRETWLELPWRHFRKKKMMWGLSQSMPVIGIRGGSNISMDLWIQSFKFFYKSVTVKTMENLNKWSYRILKIFWLVYNPYPKILADWPQPSHTELFVFLFFLRRKGGGPQPKQQFNTKHPSALISHRRHRVFMLQT